MFEPLLVADPSFQPRWTEFTTEWSDEPDLPLYLALGSLAEHILARLKVADTGGFEDIFAVVERWHTEGDAYVSEAASIGLLESRRTCQAEATGKKPPSSAGLARKRGAGGISWIVFGRATIKPSASIP